MRKTVLCGGTPPGDEHSHGDRRPATGAWIRGDGRLDLLLNVEWSPCHFEQAVTAIAAIAAMLLRSILKDQSTAS